MCGSSNNSGKSKNSGRTASDHFNGAYGGALGAEAVRDMNRALMGRGTNITNSPGYSGSSRSTLGGDGQAAKTTQTATPAQAVDTATAAKRAQAATIAGSVPTAPMGAFDDMQDDIAAGKVVNAAQYSRLGTQAISQARRVSDLKDAIETKNTVDGMGTWVDDATGKPAGVSGMMNQSFKADRWMGGSVLDSLTGKSRTLSMERAMQDREESEEKAKDRAASLSSGNTKVDELGNPREDKLGTTLDALSVAKSLGTALFGGLSPTTTLSTGLGLAGPIRNFARTNRLYGDYSYDDDPQNTSLASATSSTVRTGLAASVNSNPVSAMLGNERGRGAGVSVNALTSGATVATDDEDDTSTGTTTSNSSVNLSRNRLSLILTGGQGLTNSPNRLFMRLLGA